MEWLTDKLGSQLRPRVLDCWFRPCIKVRIYNGAARAIDRCTSVWSETNCSISLASRLAAGSIGVNDGTSRANGTHTAHSIPRHSLFVTFNLVGEVSLPADYFLLNQTIRVTFTYRCIPTLSYIFGVVALIHDRRDGVVSTEVCGRCAGMACSCSS